MTTGSRMGGQIPLGGTRRPSAPAPSAPPSSPAAPIRTPADEEEFVDDGVTAPGSGAATSLVPVLRPVRPTGEAYTPRTIADMQDLAWARKCRDLQQPILTYGPPGTGKTAMCEAAFFPDAKVDTDAVDAVTRYVHLGFESLVCGQDTTQDDFFGTWVQDPDTGNFEWAPGPLQRAVEFGVPLYVDEIFLADSRTLSATIYPLMDGRNVLRIPTNPRLGDIVVQPGFFIVGSGNPDVPGAVFSDALRSRFKHHVYVDTDWALAKTLKVPQNFITAAKKMDTKRISGDTSWSPQLREALAFRDDKANFGEAYAVANLLGKAPREDRKQISADLSAFGDASTALQFGGRHAG